MSVMTRRVFKIALAILGLLIVGRAIFLVRQEWLFSAQLAKGVKIVQEPFGKSYDIRTAKGVVLENVEGWIIRPGCIYGSYGRTKYFFIDLTDLNVSRFDNIFQITLLLKANGLPVYDMSDEESISHLKYQGGNK